MTIIGQTSLSVGYFFSFNLKLTNSTPCFKSIHQPWLPFKCESLFFIFLWIFNSFEKCLNKYWTIQWKTLVTSLCGPNEHCIKLRMYGSHSFSCSDITSSHFYFTHTVFNFINLIFNIVCWCLNDFKLLRSFDDTFTFTESLKNLHIFTKPKLI